MDGRIIVITGASSGLGKGVAQRLAAQGARLVLAARRSHLLRELAEECGDALAITCDVADAGDVEKLAAAALAKYGRIDVWVNNAGVAALGRFEEIPLEDHRRVIETNLLGTINGSHVAMRHFRRLGAGTLVNIASMLGKTTSPYYASYCASKHGVVALGAALRQEVRADGVRGIHVCTILPMAADTTFFDHAANYTGHTLQPYPIADADTVVGAIVDAIASPRDEMIVGLSARAALLAQQAAPSLTESITGVVTHQLQIEDAPAAAPTHGNLHVPVELGTGVGGGVRARMAAEQRVRH